MKVMKVWMAWSRVALVAGVSGLSMLLIACGSGGGPAAAPVGERGTVSSPGVSTPTPTPSPAAQQTTATPPPTPAPTAPPVAGRTPSPSLSAREIKVTLKDRTFSKEIRVKVGEKVVFVVTNEGTVKHTFEFPDFDEMRFNEIEVGQTMRIEWVVPNKKGKWDMGCFLTEEGYHEGMEGTLVIE